MATRRAGGRDVLVVVPTHNERDNLQVLVPRLVALQVPGLRVLVVDDNSSDGSGVVADGLAVRSQGVVTVLHRSATEGRGRACLDGMRRALADGADIVVQMEADLSYRADEILWLLAAVERPGVDLVIGSRHLPGGLTAGRPWTRRVGSSAANAYVERILGLGVSDATSGLRAWRADALRAIDLDSIISAGPAFEVEMTQRGRLCGQRIVEVPIGPATRTGGRSRTTLAARIESASMPWRLRRQAPDRCGRRNGYIRPTCTDQHHSPRDASELARGRGCGGVAGGQ